MKGNRGFRLGDFRGFLGRMGCIAISLKMYVRNLSYNVASAGSNTILPLLQAGVVELADTKDSKSFELNSSCGFKSRLRYSLTFV